MAAGVLGRGAAGRADKIYGNRLRSLGGNNNRVDRQTLNTSNRNVSELSTRGNSNPSARNANSEVSQNRDNNPNSEISQRQSVSTNPQRNPEFEAVANAGSSNKIEVISDPNLSGNTVRVEYDMADDGTVRGVRMRAGAEATADDIRLHQHTAKVMRMYGGTLGRVRVVEAKIAKWLGIHGQPQTGTKAWEAQHEVPKLENIINQRMKTLETAEPDEAVKLENEIEYLTDQLWEHRRTFDQMDESDGWGYIAAEGYADVHDHYSGKLDPGEFLSTTDYDGNYTQAVTDIYNWLLNEDVPLFKTDGIGNPIDKNGNIVEVDQDNKPVKAGQKIASTNAGQKQKSTGKNNINILQQKLSKAGMLDKDGKLVSDIDPEKAKEVMVDLLSATDDAPFDSVYAFRRLFRPNTVKYANAVSQKLISQEIEYAEIQGDLSISRENWLSAFANDKLQAWFLGLLKGSNRLATTKGGGALDKNDRKRIRKLGDKRAIGVDFAGAESERFTDDGMKLWRNFYEGIDAKAKDDDGTYVLRTHVGEGSVERDALGNPIQNNQHRDIANHNVGKVVDTLVGMDENDRFSDNVVTRLGHMTHADFEQLSRLDSISKEHGVIVEANLSSNLATKSVDNRDERDRVLLKFLYQDNLRVTLNTDGGGVMKTTIENEYEIASDAIRRFESGELPLIDEKGKTMYYYDRAQIPRKIPDELLEYNHVAIPESKKKNYNTERLRAESDRYIDDVAPTIGSAEQRKENIESVNRHKQKNQNETENNKRKNTDGEEPPEKKAKQ